MFFPQPGNPPPGTVWLHGEVRDCVICIILPRDRPWPSPAIVSVTARAHDSVSDAGGYDLDGPTIRLIGGGSTEDCAHRIADILRCAFRQQAGVDVIVDVSVTPDGDIKITVKIPGGCIDRGMLTICVGPG